MKQHRHAKCQCEKPNARHVSAAASVLSGDDVGVVNVSCGDDDGGGDGVDGPLHLGAFAFTFAIFDSIRNVCQFY